MATVNKLLADRGTADTKHRQAMRVLAASVTAAPNRRTIAANLAVVEEAFEVLIQRHVSYVLKLGASMDNAEHQGWIDTKGDTHYQSVQAAKDALELIDADPENLPPPRQVADVREDLAVKILRINALHTNLEAALAEDMNVEQHEAIGVGLTDLQNQWEAHQTLERELRTLDPDNDAALRTEHGGYRADKIAIIERIRVGLARKRPGVGPPAQPAVAPAGEGVATARPPDPPGGRDRRQAKLPPLQLRSFSGKAKDYKPFELQFNEMVTPYYDEATKLEYLVKSLPVAVKNKMSLVRKNTAQIWAQLRDWYDDPKIILKEAVAELHALADLRVKPSELMIKFCNTLLDTETLLDEIGSGDYLRHPREVAALEDLLPNHEAQEFIRREARLVGNEYEKLRGFLMERKTEIQKLEKLGSKSRIDLVDHPQEKKSERQGRGCFRCGEKDHIIKDCPKSPVDRDKGAGTKNRNRGDKPDNKAGNNNVNHETNTNQFRPTSCRRCKRASSLNKACPGCMKTGTDLTHCLGHCSKYTMESVNGKSDMVKKAGACVICLGVNHMADTCNFRDKDASICGLDDCKSHHHPSLHGSRDNYVTSVGSIRVSIPQQSNRKVDVFTSWRDKEDKFFRINGSTYEEEFEQKRRLEEIKELEKLLHLPMINGDQILLQLQKLQMQFGCPTTRVSLSGFFDNGSTCSLILDRVAKKYELLGQNVRVTISTINGEKERHTKLYVVELVDRDGKVRIVRALGVDNISGPIPNVNMDGLKPLFSDKVQKAWTNVMDRPTKEIEILVGSEVANIHPEKVEAVDNLIISKSLFGTGWAIHGHHEDIKGEHVSFSEEVSEIRQNGLRVLKCGKIDYRVNLTYKQDWSVNLMEMEKHSDKEFRQKPSEDCNANLPKDFALIEDLGVEPPRRCEECRKCKECSWRSTMQSEKEAEEYRLIEEGIHYCEDSKRFIADYPFLQDPARLGNNFRQVEKMAAKEEDRLERDGMTQMANERFAQMRDLGAVGRLSQMEMDTWGGPVHYVSVQHVMNLSSSTTPLRLVTNTSLKDPKSGLSLNEILAKGPNCLGETYELLLRLRNYLQTLIGDLTKAYYCVMTSLLASHLRRILWRWGNKDAEWEVYMFLVVSMGDRPAATILEVVIKKTLRMFGKIDPLAAHRLERDRFVDDIVTGGTTEEVDRFFGTEDPDSLQCSGTMPQILKNGNLRFKALARSGEKDGDKLLKLGAGVLGHGYSTEHDMITIRLRVNISRRKRGVFQQPDLQIGDLESMDLSSLNRRKCLSIGNSLYDILGVLAPISIAIKIAQKDLFSPMLNLGWDTVLPKEEQDKWEKIICTLVRLEKVDIPRRTFTKDSLQDDWMIIAYFDASDLAYSCVLYGRWKLQEGGFHTSLLTSKAKVNPWWTKNTPRLELNGAVLMTRLVVRVVRAYDVKPSKVIMAGDSETVLAAREKNSRFFNEFFSNRVGETWDNQKKIEEFCPIGSDGEWYHVSSSCNPADVASRSNLGDVKVDKDSSWQRGPDYLLLPEEDWPMERNFASKKKVQIPAEEIAKRYRDQLPVGLAMIELSELEKIESEVEIGQTTSKAQVVEPSLLGPEEPNNPIRLLFQDGKITNSWTVLLRRTGLLFRWLTTSIWRTQGVCVSERDLATTFWLRSAMLATREALKQGKLKKLTTWEHEGLVVVTGRAEQGLKHYYGVQNLPVIMASTRVGFLIMLHSHEEDHSNRDTTLATSAQYAWIVGGRTLAAKIKALCVRCRFLDKKLLGQKMAVLPKELTVPCPPFSHVGVDLAGPVSLRIVGGGKTTRTNKGVFKAWIVLVVCLNTKALKLYVACGYSTRDFLLTWDQHVSDCGHPRLVHSDRGSQLVSAAEELKARPEYDWDFISKTTAGDSTWKFCPAGAQFRNGATEIFVKKVKRSLVHTYGDKNLNLQEFITAVKRVANVLNSRPVYAVMGPTGGADPDFIQPLTPNMMLTGRTTRNMPARQYEDTSEPLVRLAYVTELEKLWWGQHKVQDFLSLVPTMKWTEQRRNTAPGDIVMIQYSSMSKAGSYRLGRVILVETDSDNLVRTCVVRYSLIQHLSPKERLQYKGVTRKLIRVAVQRLVLIVPVEEQVKPIKISEEDKSEASRLSEKAADLNSNLNVNLVCEHNNSDLESSGVKKMLQNKGEFDQIWSGIEMSYWQSLRLEYNLDDDQEFEPTVEDVNSCLTVDCDEYQPAARDIIERPYILYDYVSLKVKDENQTNVVLETSDN